MPPAWPLPGYLEHGHDVQSPPCASYLLLFRGLHRKLCRALFSQNISDVLLEYACLRETSLLFFFVELVENSALVRFESEAGGAFARKFVSLGISYIISISYEQSPFPLREMSGVTRDVE